MRVNWLRLTASILAVTTMFALFANIPDSFTPFEHASFPIEESMTPVEEEMGLEVSRAMWSYRQIDLITLAILLFATATCCTIILKVKRGED